MRKPILSRGRNGQPEKIHLLLGLAILICFLFSCQQRPKQALELAGDSHRPHDYLAKRGMVVAAHPLAVESGVKVLKKGGNAVDAAVATAFALNAVEPFASGIGGGGFMVLYLAREKKVTVINFRETAPGRANPAMYLENEKVRNEWRTSHGLAVATPGALAGWIYALRHYGSMELEEVMQGGIEIAEKGFPVSRTFSQINKDEYEKLLENGGESCVYLKDGFPYEPGEIFRNPDLAKTFRRLASKGWQDFYRGDLARLIVEAVQRKGGIMEREDLARYSPIEQPPLKGAYKGYTLYSIPPPGSGGLHIIQLLNIIENWPVKEWGFNSARYIHHLSEAFRFVFADKARYLGDPEFVSVPVENLLSKDYASRIAARIKPASLQDSYPPGRFDNKRMTKESTTHLGVIDEEGNIVSLTQSINDFFGSGIIPEGTGFLLNDEMADFSTNPDSANAPAPYHRPVSSMGPLILFQNKTPFLVLGSPGGPRIFTSLTQIVINCVEFGMSIDQAIEAPRFFTYSSGGSARELSVESRVPDETIRSLRKIGHLITIREAYDKFFGGAQGIMILPAGEGFLGGADSRRDGFGAGY
jgi:gamma-glutamyltranspeptidase/glutathione hydrolase